MWIMPVMSLSCASSDCLAPCSVMPQPVMLYEALIDRLEISMVNLSGWLVIFEPELVTSQVPSQARYLLLASGSSAVVNAALVTGVVA